MKKHFKKPLKLLAVLLILLLAALGILFGSYTYVTSYKTTDIAASVSPDGAYELRYQAVGEPDWPFGASHARIVLKHGRQTIGRYRFDVANDGKNLQEDNWSVEWLDDHAVVTISGEEQPDEARKIYFDGTIE